MIKVEIKESEVELRELLRLPKNILRRRRLFALLLLKTGELTRLKDISDRVGVSEQSVYQWMRIYKQKGLTGLLTKGHNACTVRAKNPAKLQVKASTIEIKESEIELKNLLKSSQSRHQRQKLQALLLLKDKSLTQTRVSDWLRVDRSKLSYWIKVYRRKGLAGLLAGRNHSSEVKIEIQETKIELENLLLTTQGLREKEKIQMLLWIKTGQITSP